MADEPRLPLRADSDPQVLAAQLTQALQDLPAEGARYQGYLAQVVRSCFLAIQDGDLESPQASLDLLVPALHLGERLVGSTEAAEAAAWMRATARFFEIAKEALAPRLTLDTLLARDRSETEREVLRILLRAEKVALRRGEIAARWDAAHAQPTDVRIGQILASFHDVGLVVRIKQPARGGSDVAFYRLSRLGRELCEQLRLPTAMPEGLVPQERFYARLKAALRVDTTAPIYLTTFDNLDHHRSARRFHDEVLASLSEIRRPVHWIFTPSTFFTGHVQPRIQGARAADAPAGGARSVVHLYLQGSDASREPTIQVLDGDSYFYPIAPKIALTASRDAGRETWELHRTTANVA